jgi:hypothetical protein
MRQSNAEIDAPSRSFADTEHVITQLQSVFLHINLNEQELFQKEYSVSVMKSESWWETISVQALWKPLPDMSYIFDVHKCIWYTICQSQFGEWVPLTILPLIFLNGYLSPK